MKDTIKAVLWDFGGVITSSPFEAFNKFEIQEQIPVDFIRQTNAENHETNAWAKLESSEIDLDEFDRLFRLETLAKGNEISGKAVINLLSGEIRPSMVNVLKRIKKAFFIARSPFLFIHHSFNACAFLPSPPLPIVTAGTCFENGILELVEPEPKVGFPPR